ncbi:hypothetical protein PInf_022455 [Phytophthora infestans]|nr:hypothetical protein PInf_022455 [Phytophthora infestans]
MAAPQATRPKPVWLKAPVFEGKEGENLQFGSLFEQLRAAFLPADNEFRQRSRFLACKQGKRELQEYVQEMRTLVTSLAGNPLPEDIKTTVFMNGSCLHSAIPGASDSYGGGPSKKTWFAATDAADMGITSVCGHRQSSGRRKPVDPRSGGAGYGQVDEDSQAISRGGMPY